MHFFLVMVRYEGMLRLPWMSLHDNPKCAEAAPYGGGVSHAKIRPKTELVGHLPRLKALAGTDKAKATKARFAHQ
jgi:hypothetical protein